jgi:hypothetical protein
VPRLERYLALECHLLSLVIGALDRHTPDGSVFCDQALLAPSPKAWKGKLHVVEIRGLVKCCLRKIWWLLHKRYAREKKSSTTFASNEIGIRIEHATVQLDL